MFRRSVRGQFLELRQIDARGELILGQLAELHVADSDEVLRRGETADLQRQPIQLRGGLLEFEGRPIDLLIEKHRQLGPPLESQRRAIASRSLTRPDSTLPAAASITARSTSLGTCHANSTCWAMSQCPVRFG